MTLNIFLNPLNSDKSDFVLVSFWCKFQQDATEVSESKVWVCLSNNDNKNLKNIKNQQSREDAQTNTQDGELMKSFLYSK